MYVNANPVDAASSVNHKSPSIFLYTKPCSILSRKFGNRVTNFSYEIKFKHDANIHLYYTKCMSYFDFEAPHQRIKYTGLQYNVQSKRWVAFVFFGGDNIYLGSHAQYDVAVLAIYNKLKELYDIYPTNGCLAKKLHHITSTWDALRSFDEPFDTRYAMDGRLTPWVKSQLKLE